MRSFVGHWPVNDYSFVATNPNDGVSLDNGEAPLLLRCGNAHRNELVRI